MEILRQLVQWTVSWANTPYGGVALFAIAFAESSFFPVPPDVLMIPLALAQTSKALFFAAVATAGSTLGGIFGFFIGYIGGRPLLQRLFKPEKVALVQGYYQRYDVWAVGIAGFTPIPYKLFSISAGVFGLDLRRFILASIAGRGGRFFLVGLVIMVFGEPVKTFLDAYFDLAVIAFTLLLVGGFYVVNLLARQAARKGVKASSLPSDNPEPMMEE
ncbi:MAG: YqaA family protein [Anaerolineae bacterium]|nr:DedA family protein [Anaerolineae bacterium]MDW8099629.1 YqaA family protein [Anaerolineae bacterium]